MSRSAVSTQPSLGPHGLTLHLSLLLLAFKFRTLLASNFFRQPRNSLWVGYVNNFGVYSKGTWLGPRPMPRRECYKPEAPEAGKASLMGRYKTDSCHPVNGGMVSTVISACVY